ncbi:MAG TPA: aspartate--tRNA(Asn) ligase [Gammaproteobacteria bacterium]|nr:aspartate--tRNA(Asn) ligase [Gammaproteobacteria bacterium]
MELSGWVDAIRDQKAVQFVILRDSKQNKVQLVNPKSNKDLTETISSLTNESTITVRGKVEKNEIVKLGGVEVKLESVEVLSKAGEVLPMDETSGLDVRLDWRYLDLRDPKKRLIFEVNTTIQQAMRDYWLSNGFIEIHTPKFMETASETKAELFEVKYFDRKAYLAQSPQFFKQMAMSSGFDKIFEIGEVFRADPSFTTRHATEYTSVDSEISWVDSHEDVMEFMEGWLAHIMKQVIEKNGARIEELYGIKLQAPKTPFERLTLAEAKSILEGKDHKLGEHDDLDPEGERKLSEHFAEAGKGDFVFVTDYPANVRAFYHMQYDDQPGVTKSFDLLYRGVEISTGAQREHRLEKLESQAKDKGLDPAQLKHYFDFFRYGVPPHGGFGFGSERFLMKLLGLESVREAMYLFRGPNRLEP